VTLATLAPLSVSPPADVDAEAAVLGCLLIAPDAYSQVADILEPGDFYAPKNGAIFGAAGKVHESGAAIDTALLAARLREKGSLERAGGIEYLAQLAQVMPTAASVRHYAEIVLDRAIRRRLQATGERLAREAVSELTRDELIGNVERDLLAVQQRTPTEAVSADQAVTELIAEIDDRGKRQGSHFGVLSGFRHLDALTLGLHRGEMTILAARPSVGKTAMVCQWAREAAGSGHRVLICSLEMTRQRVMERLLASDTGIDLMAIRCGLPGANPATWDRVVQAGAQISELPLAIDERGGQTVSMVRGAAVAFGRQHKGLDLLVIDYLGLMRTPGRQQSSYERVSQLSGDLKALAKELHVPLLVAAQLNRASARENRPPRLDDLRDSGSVEQDADTVLFIHRPPREGASGLSNETSLIVEKNRNGPPGLVRLSFVPTLTKFTEQAKEAEA
jgi:replicative DNA helicase